MPGSIGHWFRPCLWQVTEHRTTTLLFYICPKCETSSIILLHCIIEILWYMDIVLMLSSHTNKFYKIFYTPPKLRRLLNSFKFINILSNTIAKSANNENKRLLISNRKNPAFYFEISWKLNHARRKARSWGADSNKYSWLSMHAYWLHGLHKYTVQREVGAVTFNEKIFLIISKSKQRSGRTLESYESLVSFMTRIDI